MRNIGNNLTPPRLLACVQVCSHWHEIFTPLLWQVIDDTNYAWPTLLKSLAEQYPLLQQLSSPYLHD
jgi:hypothetical protein